MNVVSDKFVQRARRCISWSVTSVPSRTTATGLPRRSPPTPRDRLDDADLNGPPTDTRRTSVQIISLTGAPFQVTRHVKH